MPRLEELPAWQALTKHHGEIAAVQMRDLFARDPQRFERFSLRLAYHKSYFGSASLDLTFSACLNVIDAGGILISAPVSKSAIVRICRRA